MAIDVLRNVCLTRVRTVYLIRYNLPWRKITYCHLKEQYLAFNDNKTAHFALRIANYKG